MLRKHATGGDGLGTPSCRRILQAHVCHNSQVLRGAGVVCLIGAAYQPGSSSLSARMGGTAVTPGMTTKPTSTTRGTALFQIMRKSRWVIPSQYRDKDRLLGLSVIEEIETEMKEKLLFKCPSCGKAGIKARKNKTPRFKCYKCGAPPRNAEKSRTATVVEYRSRHDAAWTSLENLLGGEAI